MNFATLFAHLSSHTQAIHALTRGISLEEARWKPDAESWSILEVINHLYDEERRDFRVRLDIILHRPAEPFPPIDPPRWVVQEKYNERDLEASVQNFLDERANSLRWLSSLQAPNWDASITNQFGTITAGEMFSAWVAHDILHLRQLVELHYALVARDAEPFGVEYAGEW
ncbi:MAG: DinB family protein [Chloroflexi bacterium]|nr:DinB family protein [Chloroflexota bacterium]